MSKWWQVHLVSPAPANTAPQHLRHLQVVAAPRWVHKFKKQSGCQWWSVTHALLKVRAIFIIKSRQQQVSRCPEVAIQYHTFYVHVQSFLYEPKYTHWPGAASSPSEIAFSRLPAISLNLKNMSKPESQETAVDTKTSKWPLLHSSYIDS